MNQANKTLTHLKEAFREHDTTTKHYQRLLVHQQNEPTTKLHILQQTEESYHLHNCITAVLAEIIYKTEGTQPAIDDYF